MDNNPATDQIEGFFSRLLSEFSELRGERLEFSVQGSLCRVLFFKAGHEIKLMQLRAGWFASLLTWLDQAPSAPDAAPGESNDKGERSRRVRVVLADQTLSFDYRSGGEAAFTLRNFSFAVGGRAVNTEAPSPVAAPAAAGVVPAAEPSAAGARILVVDDDVDQRGIMSMLLGFAGYEVVTAADGVEALAWLAQGTADLVITDLMMPRLDGAGLVQRLKQEAHWAVIPVLVLTVVGDPEKEVSLLDLGADDYCEKTVHRTVLLKRVENLLKRSG